VIRTSETERFLNDIRSYLRISAAAASRAVAKTVLDTYEKASVYSKLDGKTSQTKIEADTKVPQATISVWLGSFVQGGLVSVPSQYNSSHKALFTLQELGIEFDTLKKRTKVSKTNQELSPAPEAQKPTEHDQSVAQKTLEPEKSGTSSQ
jgi:ribosomal 50S subunit-recycling heat shock protein